LSAANKSLKPALTFVERMPNVRTSQETATGALTGFGCLIAMPGGQHHWRFDVAS